MEVNEIQVPVAAEFENLRDLREFFVNQFDDIHTKFKVFSKQIQEVSNEVATLFSESIDSDPAELKEKLSEYSAMSYTVGNLLSRANSFLTIYETIYFCPKISSMSETDRKNYTRIKTIFQTEMVSNLKNAADKINKRITILQSILKHETVLIQSGEFD
jgi:5'-deoxynucleotidase YfbR-like HD superfamily hydrolase